MSLSLSSLTLPKDTSNFIKGKWSPEEDELLRAYVEKFGEKKWKKISELMQTRSPLQCLHRWTKILRPGMIKGPWTFEEDQSLRQWVMTYGPNKWSLASRVIPGRNGKQCRERWINHLNPEIKKGNWTEEEDEKIYQMYKVYGSAWSKIAKCFDGRSENSIKNRFYATLKKFEHVKKHSEILSFGKESFYDSATLSPSSNEQNQQFYFDEALLDREENLCSNYNENFFQFDDISSSFNEKCTNNCENPLNFGQNDVMQILGEIMEDDKKLDNKILDMIESLKSIEVEIMSKIAASMKKEEPNQNNLTNKRTFSDSRVEKFEEGCCLSKKLKVI